MLLNLWNVETLKPRNQETDKSRSQETKKLRNQATKKPRNQETFQFKESLPPLNMPTPTAPAPLLLGDTRELGGHGLVFVGGGACRPIYNDDSKKRERRQASYIHSCSEFSSKLKCPLSGKSEMSSCLWFRGSVTRYPPCFFFLSLLIGSQHSSNLVMIFSRYFLQAARKAIATRREDGANCLT